MRIKIAVDATPIVSALIGGASSAIIFDHRLDFVSIEFTFDEVKKYLPLISKKSGVSIEELNYALKLLPIKFYKKDFYKFSVVRAQKIIGKIDAKDVDILSLSFKENCFLWSEDKHFRNKKEIRLVRTKDLI
jgi:predicted nucleic acid-binding protein